MSVITAHNAINIHYPVAGQDNNSQGFRDNFGQIQNAFNQTDTALTDLTDNSVRKGALTTNDLAGAVIENGAYNKFNGIVSMHDVPTGTTPLDISINDGPLQEVTLHAGQNFIVFNNWPVATLLSSTIRLHLINTSDSACTVEPMATDNNFTVIYEDTKSEEHTSELQSH